MVGVMDDSDILMFGRSGTASYKAARKAIKNKPYTSISTCRRPSSTSTSQTSDSSGSNSSYSDEDDVDNIGRRRLRKRKHKSRVGGKMGSLASSLIHNKTVNIEPCVIDSESEDSDTLVTGRYGFQHGEGECPYVFTNCTPPH